MRLIIMFDLPTYTTEDKKCYTKFRKNLIHLGFNMIQYSIYTRIIKNNDDANKYIQHIKYILPSKGSIRLLKITEKQYANMSILLGNKSSNELFLENIDTILDM